MTDSEPDPDRGSDLASELGLDGASDPEEELDLEDCPFPLCPRCGHPVVRVTSVGPVEHTASPCGCRVSGDLLE